LDHINARAALIRKNRTEQNSVSHNSVNSHSHDTIALQGVLFFSWNTYVTGHRSDFFPRNDRSSRSL